MERFTLADYWDTYPSARDRGFVAYSPTDPTMAVLRAVRAVLDEYRDHLPLTLRQVFYRLVGAHGYEKTEKAYKRLGEYLNRARRANMVPWGAIRDDGERVRSADGWDSEEQWWPSVEASAEGFALHPRIGQDTNAIFLVEAAGMVPQVSRVANTYGIDVRSSGGFNSVTVTHALGSAIARDDRPTVVLHVGDYDPSGESVFHALAADVMLFARGMGADTLPEFYRVAVTEAQVATYDLPSAPAKATDRRGDWHSSKLDATQAEAFAPDQLAAIVRDACEQFTDLDALAETRDEGAAIAERLVERIRRAAG